MLFLGCHLSSSGGFEAMGERAVSIGATTFAYFTRNPRGGNAKAADADDAAVGTYDADTIMKWLRKFYGRFFSQQFKRSCLPDGPKVGSVAVSPRGDLRMPSDAVCTLWQRELDGLE